jgi:DNA-directed RNA polymerase alpha subunit
MKPSEANEILIAVLERDKRITDLTEKCESLELQMTSYQDLRQCMIETADENDMFRKRIAELESKLTEYKTKDVEISQICALCESHGTIADIRKSTALDCADIAKWCNVFNLTPDEVKHEIAKEIKFKYGCDNEKI